MADPGDHALSPDSATLSTNEAETPRSLEVAEGRIDAPEWVIDRIAREG
jgi:hypothetical protein